MKLKSKGRPSMSKKPNNQKKKEEKKGTREEELERENELLRLENAYLKKLRAFRENPNAFHEKHKPRWHSNLGGFRLKDILFVMGIPEATYHYHVKNFNKYDPDTKLKELIAHLF
ncbi:hypothetical protein ACN6MY_08880 [Peribacillus sp. B-H-3]|uniref:hypothetical protein n=1 Tax=Peribacillus sp. B-H-3 TaxID=3400420 RepID=UPI003B02BBA6